ncbi:hypothetical protein B0H14DRAFT_3029066 [Mycena olivaceomarginata]|nr:hypothetical protein B0H14DRAFT_3029066 [Mycena olivaceomarginata]
MSHFWLCHFIHFSLHSQESTVLTLLSGTLRDSRLDFSDLAWEKCAITFLGSFDPTKADILFHLRLRSSVFIPSPIVQHSSFPIRSHETCCSFTQYTAGGSFDGRP